MQTAYHDKPAGWGTYAYPTSRGSRRVQFSLRPDDMAALVKLRKLYGLTELAEAVRVLLAAQAQVARRRSPTGWVALRARSRDGGVHEPRGFRGTGPQEPRLVRWSQWIRPDDLEALEELRRVYTLGSLSEALRFAIRAEAVDKGV